VVDVLDLADRLWRGEVAPDEYHPVSHLGGLAEIADGVAFVPSFANVSAFETGDGLVLVDTGSAFTAAAIHAELRRWSRSPLTTAVFSHGHIDHVFGVGVWEEEARGQGWPAPDVVGHEAVADRFDRYVATAGYNQVVNRRQFGVDGLVWPTEYRYPDRLYRDQMDLAAGSLVFSLRHERGETDDHTVTWLPEKKVLCPGDLFIWASPNAGNPQKVQRYPREWASALRRMVALEPEVLLPGHGLPVLGADRIAQALSETAELLDLLVDQTLELMNAGARLDEVLHSVRPPDRLMERPYLRPVYDEPEFIVRNVWRLYGGWWDGNPANLKPAPERALAVELSDLAGGPGALAARAQALVEAAAADVADDAAAAEGARRLAGHLAELAWLAAPEDPAIRAVRRQVFTARAEAASSTMATGVFGWAARESAPLDPASGSPGSATRRQ